MPSRVASTPCPDPSRFQKNFKDFDEKATAEQPRCLPTDVLAAGG